MTNYLFEEYLAPLQLTDSEIKFKRISKITKDEKLQLAKMFCTLFNADNKQVLKELNIRGRTVPEGLWAEEPYSLVKSMGIIKDYMFDQYFGVIAIGTTAAGEQVLGATIFEERSLKALVKKGYEVPFNFPNNARVWAAVDTFRRPIVVNNEPVKYLANRMKNEVIKIYKGKGPVLMYSSTNNPMMIKSWEKDGWTVVNKETTFGNKFQAFKLI
jgi:hypothetical protein